MNSKNREIPPDRESIGVGDTLVFILPNATWAKVTYTPDASGRAMLALPAHPGETVDPCLADGRSIVEFPDPDTGSYSRCRYFPAGEIRIVCRSGDGFLTVCPVASRETYSCDPPFANPAATMEIVSPPPPAPWGGRNVRQYGAKGDGIANDTAAIQKALDAGGAVYVPGGRYKIGTIYLRSNGGLNLAPDAVLVASPDINDYNPPDFCPQNIVLKMEKTDGRHLIVAVECDQVFLDGFGTIDGNRPAFFDPGAYRSRDEFPTTRPAHMLFFSDSNDVRIQNVKLVNSCYWSCFLHGCTNVLVSGIQIHNWPKESWNGDGLSIDCCKNVNVSNCVIRSSDDSICVRASSFDHLRRNNDGVCENVNISNCIIMKGHCGIRFGVGNGLIRNCTVGNCSIKNCWVGIGIHSSYLPRGENVQGVDIDNIAISNVSIWGGGPFYIADCAPIGAGPDRLDRPSRHTVKNITMSNIQAHCCWNGIIEGARNLSVSNLLLNNIQLFIYGGDEIVPELPERDRCNYLAYRCPYALRIRNLRNSSISNLHISFDEHASPRWRKAVDCQNNVNVNMVNCMLPDPPQRK